MSDAVIAVDRLGIEALAINGDLRVLGIELGRGCGVCAIPLDAHL